MAISPIDTIVTLFANAVDRNYAGKGLIAGSRSQAIKALFAGNVLQI